MKFYRNLLALALIVAAAAWTTDHKASTEEKVSTRFFTRDLIVGKRRVNDELVYQKNINEGASYIGRKVTYEETITVPRGYIITEVRALDVVNHESAAYAIVTGGGPGRKSISLKFKSQRFHGIYFIVQVYAKFIQ